MLSHNAQEVLDLISSNQALVKVFGIHKAGQTKLQKNSEQQSFYARAASLRGHQFRDIYTHIFQLVDYEYRPKYHGQTQQKQSLYEVWDTRRSHEKRVIKRKPENTTHTATPKTAFTQALSNGRVKFYNGTAATRTQTDFSIGFIYDFQQVQLKYNQHGEEQFIWLENAASNEGKHRDLTQSLPAHWKSVSARDLADYNNQLVRSKQLSEVNNEILACPTRESLKGIFVRNKDAQTIKNARKVHQLILTETEKDLPVILWREDGYTEVLDLTKPKKDNEIRITSVAPKTKNDEGGDAKELSFFQRVKNFIIEHPFLATAGVMSVLGIVIGGILTATGVGSIPGLLLMGAGLKGAAAVFTGTAAIIGGNLAFGAVAGGFGALLGKGISKIVESVCDCFPAVANNNSVDDDTSHVQGPAISSYGQTTRKTQGQSGITAQFVSDTGKRVEKTGKQLINDINDSNSSTPISATPRSDPIDISTPRSTNTSFGSNFSF